ncbi:MAG: Benzoate/toluate 1,2-dioxygenase beta subunit [Caulobacter sp.]|nr:Benzoate/toluate 1,2-dioxygenase beta subunit [Caulobacter sp.]
MSTTTLLASQKSLEERARDLVMLEGYLLDHREWDAWLDLYWDQASYWVPAWKDEYSVTNDPQGELSLIYYPNRSGLEDRIFRIRTNKSLACMPLPRTTHMTSITRVTDLPGGEIQVDANWVVHVYRLDKAHAFFGQQTHVLRRFGDALKIVSRRTVLNNDTVPDVLDIYSI